MYSGTKINFDPLLELTYRDSKVAILGGGGFVGGWLRLALRKHGATISVFDNLSRGFSSSRHMSPVRNDNFYNIDVSRPDLLSDMLTDCDYVFNLAASVAGVLYNEGHHTEMYASNISVLTGPVLAASMAGVPSFLQTSSVCVYAPEYNSPSVEEYGMVGEPHPANAGYAEAKRDGERFAIWSKIQNVVIVRPSNVAGYGDYFDEKAHVIPAFIKRAITLRENKERVFKLYGNPFVTREFIHPADVAIGMMYVMAFGDDREAYNLGTSGRTTISMADLAKTVLEKVGVEDYEISVDATAGGGDPRRMSSGEKTLQGTGWQSEHTLDEIIDSAIYDCEMNWGV